MYYCVVPLVMMSALVMIAITYLCVTIYSEDHWIGDPSLPIECLQILDNFKIVWTHPTFMNI